MPVLLWSNSSPAAGTTYTLSESVSNFKYIIIEYRTNVEHFIQIVPSSIIEFCVATSNHTIGYYTAGADGTGRVTSYAYQCQSAIRFMTVTTFKFTNAYTNQNWAVRPVNMFGIK